MKQTVFMVALTVIGACGSFFDPFVGLVVYYFFAALRPNAIWAWALPQLGWSEDVAIPALIATLVHAMSTIDGPRSFRLPHLAAACFAAWLGITDLTAQNQDVAWIGLVEYFKIFTMLFAACLVIRHVAQLRLLLLVVTGAVAYIAYEINIFYFTVGRISIATDGFGGLDNNGAALMLAMAVPACLFIAIETTKVWRYFYAALIPIVLHAVLMTFSRGSMVALLLTAPIVLMRGRRRGQLALAAAVIAVLIPILAGTEIRSRFFSAGDYQTDGSAQARFQSWQAAYRMSLDYPVFGVGIRNSPLFSHLYGADMEGRVIHNQYLQVLCDGGFPSLFFYLLMIWLTWRSLRRVQRATRGRSDEVAKTAYMVAVATECSLMVFLVGSLFLSLEFFELPYILILIGIQLPTALTVDDALQELPAARPVDWPPPHVFQPGHVSGQPTGARS